MINLSRLNPWRSKKDEYAEQLAQFDAIHQQILENEIIISRLAEDIDKEIEISKAAEKARDEKLNRLQEELDEMSPSHPQKKIQFHVGEYVTLPSGARYAPEDKWGEVETDCIQNVAVTTFIEGHTLDQDEDRIAFYDEDGHLRFVLVNNEILEINEKDVE